MANQRRIKPGNPHDQNNSSITVIPSIRIPMRPPIPVTRSGRSSPAYPYTHCYPPRIAHTSYPGLRTCVRAKEPLAIYPSIKPRSVIRSTSTARLRAIRTQLFRKGGGDTPLKSSYYGPFIIRHRPVNQTPTSKPCFRTLANKP